MNIERSECLTEGLMLCQCSTKPMFLQILHSRWDSKGRWQLWGCWGLHIFLNRRANISNTPKEEVKSLFLHLIIPLSIQPTKVHIHCCQQRTLWRLCFTSQVKRVGGWTHDEHHHRNHLRTLTTCNSGLTSLDSLTLYMDPYTRRPTWQWIWWKRQSTNEFGVAPSLQPWMWPVCVSCQLHFCVLWLAFND